MSAISHKMHTSTCTTCTVFKHTSKIYLAVTELGCSQCLY